MHTAGFMLKVCCFCLLCWLRESKTRGKTIESDREREKEKEGGKTRESWATEQHCAKQLWHSQISPWLLSAGTWTLGLLGFGGQPRPHNPPSAPSSCLTPLWPRAEDRKIRAVPSQRDSFILPAGILPVTMAYIMGNIAGPRRNQSPPLNNLLSFFPHQSILLSAPLPSLLHFLCSPSACDISFVALALGHIYYTRPRHNLEAQPHTNTHTCMSGIHRAQPFSHTHMQAPMHTRSNRCSVQVMCTFCMYIPDYHF